MYGRDIISLEAVKFALNSMELRNKLNRKGSYDQVDGLFAIGRQKIPLILYVDRVRGIKVTVKENQEVDCSQSQRRK